MHCRKIEYGNSGGRYGHSRGINKFRPKEYGAEGNEERKAMLEYSLTQSSIDDDLRGNFITGRIILLYPRYQYMKNVRPTILIDVALGSIA